MKLLDLSNIGTGVALPLKSGSLQFLQDSYKEAVSAVLTLVNTTYLANTVYVLSGCKNTGSGTNYILSAGYLYYNDEIFKFNGATFSTGAGAPNFAYANLLTTQYLGNGINADPVTFTDGTQDNIHNIREFVISSTSTPTGYPYFEQFVVIQPSWLTGDIKEIDCSNAYITANFNGTGLGIGERIGWAICNGNNGTRNRGGKVGLQYQPSLYGTMGATGGAATHVLTIPELPTNNIAVHSFLPSIVSGGGSGPEPWFPQSKNFGGSNTPHNNLQPYIVSLFIQKI